MGFIQRIAGLFGPKETQLVVIHDEATARATPIQVPLHAGGMPREPAQICECGKTMRPFVLTTLAPEVDPALTASNPIAIDVFRCMRCGIVRAPIRLTPEDVTALTNKGTAHVQAHELDDAEICFRRVANSWPKYAPGRMNVAAVYLERLHAEEADLNRDPVVRRLADTIISQMRDAFRGELLQSLPHATQLLALAHLRREEVGLAQAAVAASRDREGITDEDRAELARIEEWVGKRVDLYERGTKAVSELMRLDERPAPELTPANVRRLRSGIDDLERHVRVNPASWQALFFAGMGEQAQQRHDRAAELFARADALHKEEPSVTRELAGALLELARFAEAEATLQDGLRRWPEDATLFCNLALVQLLSGRSGEAQASVEQALVLAPEDGISRNVRALIDDIASGKRPLPKSLAELEGRAPSQRTD